MNAFKKSKPAILGGNPFPSNTWPRWPFVSEEDIRRVTDVLKSGNWCRALFAPDSEESMTVRFEQGFARMHQAKYAVACANGTAAIEIALRAAGVQPGDEVIVPAYSFVASATAVLQIGGLPVFADIERDTYCLDPASAERYITANTRAIVVVHMAGRPANMDAIGELAKKYNLVIVEDSAQAHMAEWQRRRVGAIGDVGTFSFQNSKNMTSGEGGIIITDNPDIAEMSYSLQHIGRKKGRPFYEHHYACWNYRLTEIQAAILIGQMDRAEEQNRKRQENAKYLKQLMASIKGLEMLPDDPRVTNHGYHLYMFRVDREQFGLDRDTLVKALAAEGVPYFGGYPIPLYKNPLFQEKNFGVNGFIEGKTIDYRSTHCPVVEQLCPVTMGFAQNVLLGTKENLEMLVETVLRIQKHAYEIAKTV
ncbi:DegT/DnrJ/EryC1/StrS aminotransferase family protein [Paenibacillus sp. J2TS4]|uniref:DegT/DnrJ/EryC1/StrS family aminotransferase n=1 Tax=Paenibacillus sp. J2TS4 TaxID=2807194 RepID=UPI001B1EF332|nr:DegT/DnrJ/EryC1/StrS family aminotransferase [Paenibacillus sp. J2TS4]GIP34974.1 aminotransferase DegT [Paenibacillus sp. J2TS4]